MRYAALYNRTSNRSHCTPVGPRLELAANQHKATMCKCAEWKSLHNLHTMLPARRAQREQQASPPDTANSLLDAFRFWLRWHLTPPAREENLV